jgi:tetratricopeptide (TPR) repeat protein
MKWNDADHYCASLTLGGYSGWRLPTPDELKAIEYQLHAISIAYQNLHYPPYVRYSMKGGISSGDPLAPWAFGMLWSNNEALNQRPRHLIGLWNVNVLCTRSMDADILQIAKGAQVVYPVQDILTLKANIPLTKARLAYQSGNFQESIAQSKNALLIKPDFAPADWAIGISYGRLGQWDLAIANIQKAITIDKSYGDAKDSLKWARQGKKAAKKGEYPMAQSPQWNWTLEPPLCIERQPNIWDCQN